MELNGDTLRITAASGETNDISVALIDPDTVSVADSGAGATLNAAGADCAKVGDFVDCDAPGLVLVDFSLGDLDDEFTSSQLPASVSIGGSGGPGDNTILAGPGDDAYNGSIGDDDVDLGAGEDILDYSGVMTGVNVNLATGAVSGGGDDTVTNVEGAVGGAGDDTLIGDNGPNFLNGLGGDDTVNGSGAVEPAADGPDRLIGNAGDDTLVGQGGDDQIEGGADYDIVRYPTSNGVSANLSLGSGTDGFAGTDVLADLEEVEGSPGMDFLTGGPNADVLRGGEGVDFIQGMGGDDTLDGGTGPSGSPEGDFLSYTDSVNQITVDLSNGDPQSTGEGTDTISGFENVNGSPQEDHITGDSGENVLSGNGGPDVLNGGGDDDVLRPGTGFNVLDGQAGDDFVSYGDAAGVEVDLTAGTAVVGSEQDSLTSTEGVFGSPNDDVLQGSPGNDTLDGNGGDDALEGRGGNDLLKGSAGTDTITYAGAPAGASVNVGNLGALDGYGGLDSFNSTSEIFEGSDFADTLVGGSGADDLRGGEGADTFEGKAGADSFDGGPGADTATYVNAAAGVTVSTGADGATDDGDGSADTFDSVQNIVGSGFADDISGTSLPNNFNGGGGDDVLMGQDGDDTLTGGGGTDTVLFIPGLDSVNANLSTGTSTGEGTDSLTGIENLTGTNGADTLVGDGADNVLEGSMGTDLLQGGGGDDELAGGDGTDTASYATAAAGVTANLDESQAANDGDGGADTFGSIEKLVGSPGADTLTGRSLADDISALGGGDLVRVRDSAADTVDCGSGSDRVITDPLDTALTGCELVDDPSPPTKPTITASVPASGSNDNSPEIRGTAPAGSTVRLYGTANCTGSVLASGPGETFSAAGLTVQVADNSSTTISAQVSTSNDEDSPSACSDSFIYMESTPPPVDPPTGDTTAPDTSIEKPLGKTKDATPTFRFSSTEAGSKFECRVDRAAFTGCSSPFTSKKLKKGKHTFEVRAIDGAGNVDATPAQNRFTVKAKKKKR